MGDILLYCFFICAVLLLLGLIILILTACISGPFWLIDWLVFRIYLGRKSDRYDRFYKLSTLWLTLSYRLPKKMHKKGTRQALLGVALMLVSPPAIVTFATGYGLYKTLSPTPLSYEEITYKTREELAAITGLEDFPAFTYIRNEKDWFDGHVTVFYKFDKPLTAAFTKKLAALDKEPEYCFWHGDSLTFVMRRGWDGKYIKSPEEGLAADCIELLMGKQGFKITPINLSSHAEMLGDRKTLEKDTGVSFPKYKVVNYDGYEARDFQIVDYLLLDKKPSRDFILQLEKSPKWEKQEDGSFNCFLEGNNDSRRITVNPDSRIVTAIYYKY